MKHQIAITWQNGGQEYTKRFTPGLRLEQIKPDPNSPGGYPTPIVGAVVNNLLKDLNYPLYCSSDIEWLEATSPMGSRIIHNSLALLLSAAAEDLFPQRQLMIMHSLRYGRFCRLTQDVGSRPLSSRDIERLEARMYELAKQDLPIRKDTINKNEGIGYFKACGDFAKAQTLYKIPDKQATLYSIGNHTRHMFSKIVPSTGYLDNFSLSPFEDGFILTCHYNTPADLRDKNQLAYPKSLNVTLDNYSKWSNMQNINYCSDLNRFVENNDFNSLVIMSEARQERNLQYIADQIFQKFPQVRLVLIAGPSSSGKTSFCNRLAIELRNQGLRPITLSMDNYFLDNADTPLGADGQPDFESVSAIDTPLFNQHLLQLINGEPVEMPVFDFKTGTRSERTIPVELGQNNILLVEGIHGINETLTKDIPAANKVKIYISCMTTLSLDNLTPMSTSDNREVRRLVRDVKFRNISAEKTLLTWNKVRQGEEKNIFPFQDAADYYFNTSLIYEFSLLAPMIAPHLLAIPETSPAYPEARRLLKLANCFLPADPKAVPAYSLLQEFLGESVFEI